MFPTRIIIERPTPGGEKFSALLGASPVARRGAVACGVLALGAAGAALIGWGAPFALIGGVAATGAIALGVAAHGRETIVCQGETLAHRRGGLLRASRTAPVLALRRVSGGGPERAPLRIELDQEAWRVGRGLSGDEAGFLAWALERHVALGFRRPDKRSFTRTTAAAAKREAPAASEPETVLKHRNPPPFG